MKKLLPYLLGGLLMLLLLLVGRGGVRHRFDERITLRQQDKIPYGTAAAKNLLPALFPTAGISFDTRYPGAWDAIDMDAPQQAVILMADYFDADAQELEHLRRFVQSGNAVYLIARNGSDEAVRFFSLQFTSFDRFFAARHADSLQVRLVPPSFRTPTLYTYPGKRYATTLQQFDTARTVVLGSDESGRVNFVRMDLGRGSFFIHTAPLAFSNYFILHKNNLSYYQQVLSVLPPTTTAIVWNEYYLEKQQNPAQDKSVHWLGALLKNPSFRNGFLTALATLLLFVLLGMRRRQRMIPPHQKPKNDSLDFVKTLGRLYFDKHDHKNLALKMTAYFLEHVRTQYHMATHTLDDGFVALLHAKSGYPEPEIRHIISEIRGLASLPSMPEEQLAALHQQLERFYQTTRYGRTTSF